MKRVSIQRAVLIGAALFFSATMSFARAGENHRDLIEKANNLSLQKDRTQAVNILVTALRKESPQSLAAKEIRQALQDISNVFLGEKALQLYELAISLRKSDPAQAQLRLQEALRFESDNLTIVTELARVQILRQDCQNAQEQITKSRKWNPYDETLQLVQAQAHLCLGELSAAQNLRQQIDFKKANLQKNWVLFDLEKSVLEKNELKAREHLLQLGKLEPQHPELSYWKWKLEKNPATKNEWGRKYSLTCKSLSAAQFRQHLLDPGLCRRTSEVEAELKSAGGA